MTKYNVLIADNQELIVESLKAIVQQQPQFEFIDAVTSEYFVQKSFETVSINILITDHATMDYRSIAQLAQLQQQYSLLSIMVVTNLLNKRDVLELNRAGIRVIVTKHGTKLDVINALDACAKGRKYYSPDVLDILTTEQQSNKSNAEETIQLTSTELEIVRLVAQGLTTKEIASKKNSSFHTVMTHRKNIFRKLEINNASELVLYAIKTGLIEPMEYYI